MAAAERVILDSGSGAVKFPAPDVPHLVSLGGGRLSTGVTLQPLHPGRVSVGSGSSADISVEGTGVENVHCYIDNIGGVVTLHPVADMTSIDGVKVTKPTRLIQDEPVSSTHNDRSMSENKSLVSEPWAENSNKYIDDLAASCVLTKVSKFETLSNSQRVYSPKLFPANSATVNIPASTILSPEKLAKRPEFKKMDINESITTYNNAVRSVNQEVTANNGTRFKNGYADDGSMARSVNSMGKNRLVDPMSASWTGGENVESAFSVVRPSVSPRTTPRISDLTPSGRGFGSSSNSSCTSEPSKPTNGGYSEQRRHNTPIIRQNIESATQLRGSNSSLDEMSIRNSELELKRQQAVMERMMEQECERLERARLDEILMICAEYERQAQTERTTKPQQNRPSGNNVHSYENVSLRLPPIGTSESGVGRPQRSVPSRYENISIAQANLDVPYENITIHPSSPRTRIRTVAIAPREPAPLPPPIREICDKETKPKTNNSGIENQGPCTSTPTENQARTVVETPLIHSEPKKPADWGTPVKSVPISNGTNLFQEKFILPLDGNGSNSVEDDGVQLEVVQKEISKIVSAMSVLKGKVTDIEQQEEELKREVEMERALVEGELSAQSMKLQNDEARVTVLKKQISELDADMSETQERDIRRVAETKEALERAELEAARLEKELVECEGNPERKMQLRDMLNRQQDVVDNERKQFEDIEFRQLEEEAGWLAKREELQRELSEAMAKYVVRQDRVQQLEEQVKATGDSADGERRVLEAQKVAYVRRIEQGTQRLMELETRLKELSLRESSSQDKSDFSSEFDELPSNLLEYRQTSQDDLDRISRVTEDSPLDISDTGSLGRKTLESLKEIQRNRQIHLAQKGSMVIEQERRRVQLLKRRVADEVRAQWEERRQRELNCSSITSVTSEDGSVASSDALLQSLDEPIPGRESFSEIRNSGASAVDSSRRSQSPAVTSSPLHFSRELTASTDLLREQGLESDRDRDLDDNRPLSDVSSFDDQLSVRLRDRSTRLQQRPLTRYLPIRSGALDLRQHIETAGHQLDRCPHVLVDRTSCRGVLHKMASKFHTWQKRWFVFDRARRTLMYYSDRAERKARGGAYFQTIEEVYVDHLNSVKSPHPQLTFVVKTTDKTFHLMAPSSEAMRIWVDVIFTGAEGYQEFEHGS